MMGWIAVALACVVAAVSYRIGWRDCANQLRGRNPKGPRI